MTEAKPWPENWAIFWTVHSKKGNVTTVGYKPYHYVQITQNCDSLTSTQVSCVIWK